MSCMASRALPTHDLQCLVVIHYSLTLAFCEEEDFLPSPDWCLISASAPMYQTSNAAQPNTVPPSSCRSTSAFADVNTST